MVMMASLSYLIHLNQEIYSSYSLIQYSECEITLSLVYDFDLAIFNIELQLTWILSRFLDESVL